MGSDADRRVPEASNFGAYSHPAARLRIKAQAARMQFAGPDFSVLVVLGGIHGSVGRRQTVFENPLLSLADRTRRAPDRTWSVNIRG